MVTTTEDAVIMLRRRLRDTLRQASKNSGFTVYICSRQANGFAGNVGERYKKLFSISLVKKC